MEQLDTIFENHRADSLFYTLLYEPNALTNDQLSELKGFTYDNLKAYLRSHKLLNLIKTNSDVRSYLDKILNPLQQAGVEFVSQGNAISKLTVLFAESAIDSCISCNNFEEISLIIRFLVQLMRIMDDNDVVSTFRSMNNNYSIALLEEYLLLVMNIEYGEYLDDLVQFAFELYQSKSLFNKNNFIMLIEISTDKLKSAQLNSETKIRVLGLLIEVVNNTLYSEFLRKHRNELATQLTNLIDFLIDLEGDIDNPIISSIASSLLEKLNI